MRLTRRGWAAVAVIVLAVGSGIGFGARGLNGLAAPLLVALVAAAVQVARFERPSVERSVPPVGHRGDTVPVELHLETDTPFTATVADALSAGLATDDETEPVTVGDTTYRYEVDLVARGDQSVGPARVDARDVLGLVAGTFACGETDSVLVYPRIYALEGPRKQDLVRLYGGPGHDRQEFDQLRLYRRGDPMRDIHWKSSAKRSMEQFVVKQFSADEEARIVEVACDAPTGRSDAMADATASVVAHLYRAGVKVGLSTPAGRIDPDDDPDHRTRLLAHLARAPGGNSSRHLLERADVHVRATDTTVLVDIGRRRFPFRDLAGRRLDRTEEDRWTIATRPRDPRSRLATAEAGPGTGGEPA